MSSSLPLCIETPLVAGRALRVEFVWSGDRYRHVIAVARADGRVAACLESIEGSTDDSWPPSPPLQSLSIETLPDGRRVALLVGMAGGSHWSASIEPAAQGESIVFDIACRPTGDATPTGALGSRYALSAGSPTGQLLVAADRSWCEVRCGSVDVIVAPSNSADSGARLEVADGQSVALCPKLGPHAKTIRWKYDISGHELAACRKRKGAKQRKGAEAKEALRTLLPGEHLSNASGIE